MKRWLLAAILCLCLGTISQNVLAAAPERGLLITPPRQYIKVNAGQTLNQTFSIANVTKGKMNVKVSIAQFSVADYTYNYIFHPAKENWIYLEKTQLDLNAGQSQKLSYAIQAPADAPPGGHYFTIFVSTKIGNEEVRAAMVVYITVNGKLIQTSQIVSDTFPAVAFDGDINFKLDVRDTGNTHFFVYTIGKISNPLISRSLSESGHILLPSAVRSLDYRIPSPILPGIYHAEYGYKNEDGQITSRSKYFVYLPIWSIMVVGGIAWIILVIIRRINRRKKSTDS